MTLLSFASKQDYQNEIGNLDIWKPFLDSVFESNDISITVNVDGEDISIGFGSTYPTFIVGNFVVKFFGFFDTWFSAYQNELNVLKLITDTQEILAPRLVASGSLFPESSKSWPYIVTTKLEGKAWNEASLSMPEKLAMARELGQQIKRLHSLKTASINSYEQWGELDIDLSLSRCSMPLHLVSQCKQFLRGIEPASPVLVHSDLIDRHVFIKDGHLEGVIDWGDASIADRHYELGKLFLDLFECDKELLVSFLDASDWPVSKNFAKQCLAWAIYRQAVGLTQHFSFDLFYIAKNKLPLAEIESLDQLARELFEV